MRLFSNSLIKADAVRFKLLGVKSLNAGQGDSSSFRDALAATESFGSFANLLHKCK